MGIGPSRRWDCEMTPTFDGQPPATSDFAGKCNNFVTRFVYRYKGGGTEAAEGAG
jgi:hypothetical protein